ncbi:MAG: site-specific integrase [Acidobacteria bacterium]|nr:site-specific integrase [Acidobacteriota bacterium]
MEALPQPYKAIVALAGLSGLRRGELAALRWNDIGPDSVRVDESVYRGVLGSPKTPRSRRTVKIPTKAVELLEAWRSQSKFTEPEDFVFAIRTNTPIDLNRALERLIKPLAEKRGLPRFSYHDFRHAYTTWGRKAGVAAEVMRDLVGHTSVTMTQDVYSHMDDDDGEAVAMIGRYVWPESRPEAA